MTTLDSNKRRHNGVPAYQPGSNDVRPHLLHPDLLLLSAPSLRDLLSSVSPSVPQLTGSQADDDDLDALSFAPQPVSPAKPASSPSASAPGASSSAPQVSGRIGSAPRTSNTTWGGVRLETRYTGESTLDEPVSATIVSYSRRRGGLRHLLYLVTLWKLIPFADARSPLHLHQALASAVPAQGRTPAGSPVSSRSASSGKEGSAAVHFLPSAARYLSFDHEANAQ